MIKNEIPDFFGEMIFDSESEYEKPFCIVIDGLSSSGKTYLAKELSKGLNLYLLNSDYVRYVYYKALREHYPNVMTVIKRTVDEINIERCSVLCANRIPFIFDGNKSDRDVYGALSKPLAMGEYELIRIVINSNKTKCLDNLEKRRIGFVDSDESVKGDFLFYNPPLLQTIEEKEIVESEYTIDNIGTLEDFDKNIKLSS